MKMISLQSALTYTLVASIIVYGGVTAQDKRDLTLRYQKLLIESDRLQKSLSQVLRSNRDYFQGIEGSQKELDRLRQANDNLKIQNDKLRTNLSKFEAKINSIKEEKAYLEEMLIHKTKQLESAAENDASTAPRAASQETPEPSMATTTETDADLEKLKEQNRLLQERLDRLYKTTSDKINEINVAKIALEETVSTARKKLSDEWETVDLGAVTSTASTSPLKQMDIQEEKPQPKSEGHVLAVNSEHGFIVIDLGKADDLQNDATLEVVKDGIPIATLNVLELRDVMTACNIKEIKSGQRIEINDSVKILR